MDLRSKIMGREIKENLSRKKIIRNQYNSGDTTLNVSAVQYTVPTGKIAKVNFNSCSSLRNNNSSIDQMHWQCSVLKNSSGQKFWSNFAVGVHHGENNSGAMVTFRPWWLFRDYQLNSTGSYNVFRSGLSTGRFIDGAFDGTNNNARTSIYNSVRNDPSQSATQSPWSNSFGTGSGLMVMCDAQKDYIINAGAIIYFQARVQTTGGVQGTGNQCDITLEIEEMDDHA